MGHGTADAVRGHAGGEAEEEKTKEIGVALQTGSRFELGKLGEVVWVHLCVSLLGLP